jgi:tetratricopeptide (TPR) repeat protein
MTSSLPAFRHWAEGAALLQIRDQWQAAIHELEKAVEIDPTFAHGWLSLHSVYLLANQAQKSMPPLQKAMDNLYRMPERTQFDVKVEYYFMKQDHDKALAVAKMKVDLFPDDIGAHSLLAQLYNARDDKDGMIASLEKILELDPEQQEKLREIGALYEAKGDFANALKYYQQYADRFPRQPAALRSLAQLHHLRGDHAESRALYEKAMILAPTDVPSMVGLGVVERDLGEFDSARTQLDDALAAAGTAEERHRALAALANYSVFRGRLGEAIANRERMYAEGSKFQAPLQHTVQRLSGLGTYVKAGRTAEAHQVFKRVSSELHPPFDVFAALGEMELYVALEQPDEAERALTALEQAIRATGYKILNPAVTFARGRIAEALGQWERAISAYQETLKLAPSDLSTHSDISRCYRKLGQTDEAIEHGQRPLVAVPFDPRGNYELGLAYLESREGARALAARGPGVERGGSSVQAARGGQSEARGSRSEVDREAR